MRIYPRFPRALGTVDQPSSLGALGGLVAGIACSALVQLLLVAAFALPATAATTRCPGTEIFVESANPADVQEACRSVDEVRPFLDTIGLSLPRGVRIRLVDRTPGSPLEADPFVALYGGEVHAILMLDYDVALKELPSTPPGGLAITGRAMWRSYIVHELAHAAIHLSCVRICPRRAVHEYIAYVAQLSCLPSDLRTTALERYNAVGPFTHETQIDEVFYELDPGLFAAKSYRHYQQPQNGPQFVRHMLNLGYQ
jgi:hypothetical protein